MIRRDKSVPERPASGGAGGINLCCDRAEAKLPQRMGSLPLLGKEVTMQLDLRRLFEGDEQILPFVFALDLSDVQQWGDRPFQAPVKISGQATNRAGIVTVRYAADYLLSGNCARCLEPVEQKKHQEFTHTVVRKLNQQQDDDYIVCEDGVLDLDTVAQDDILLELPIRMLCSEDCKGLCPVCGANLNEKAARMGGPPHQGVRQFGVAAGGLASVGVPLYSLFRPLTIRFKGDVQPWQYRREKYRKHAETKDVPTYGNWTHLHFPSAHSAAS